MVRTVSTTSYQVNNSHTNCFGGYFTYWKLYRNMLKLQDQTGIYPYLHVQIWNFIWFCLLKPMGGFRKVTTRYKGEFVISNGYYTNKTLRKSKTYYIFGIPCWIKPKMEITDEDIHLLT